MGVVIGAALCLLLLGTALDAIDKACSSKLLRPYLGIFLIAGLIAGIGLILDLTVHGIGKYFLTAAKGLSVFSAVILCLQLIGMVAKRFLQPQ